MPGQGWGGILANLMNPVDDQAVARSITPNPSPLAQQGQSPVPPVPGAPSNPAPGQAPPQVTQPDPQLLQTNQYLMQAYRNAQQADAINRGIGQISAGFGTAQQQASKQAALAGMPGNSGAGYLDAIAKMQGIDATQTAQTEHARAAANMSVLAKALNLPDTPDGVAQATEIWNSGMLPDFAKAAADNATKTGSMKDVNQYGILYAQQNGYGADPSKWTQQQAQDVAGAQANAMAGAMGGNDLNTRQYLAAHASGVFKGTLADWNNQNTAQGKQLGDYATEKANAIETFPSLDKTYGTAEQNIDWLNSHPDALVAAVKFGPANPKIYQGAVAAGMMNQDTATARGYLDQLGDINFRAGLTDLKNVRSQAEATKIGGSVTNVDKSQMSPSSILSEAARLQTIARSAHANLTAAAGKQVPYKYNGMVDSTYLDKNSPLYNGATMEQPADLSKMNDADAEAAFEKLPSGRAYIGPDGTPRIK